MWKSASGGKKRTGLGLGTLRPRFLNLNLAFKNQVLRGALVVLVGQEAGHML